MQGQQLNQKPVSTQLVIDEYKIEVSTLTHDNIILKAYVRQLEARVAELELLSSAEFDKDKK